MKHNTFKAICTIGAILILSIIIQSCGQKVAHYTIGTGSKGATYYPLVHALCMSINQKKFDFTCEAISTEGAVYNLNSINNGTHDLATSQVHLQYQSHKGLKPFQKANEHLRTVVPLHQEIFILAVNNNAKINNIADIKNKRINIGNIGSGTRIIIEQLFNYKGWELADFEIHSKKSSELPQLLCNGKIDAAIYSTGHPNAIYEKMIRECGVKLVDFWDEDIASFVAEKRQFEPAVIPANSYPSITEQKLGFGTQVVLSASNEIPGEHIYQMIQTIVKEQQILIKLVPIFKTINVNKFALDKAAPYHDGAKKFYQETLSQ